MEKRIRKPRNSLTARQVDALKTPGKYYDGQGLFRGSSRAARQSLQRLTFHGKQRELGLGSPPVVSLAMRGKWHLRTGALLSSAETLWLRSAPRRSRLTP